jgi:peptidyl-prolyl cis-trans isomerase A (cyclophilin A)
MNSPQLFGYTVFGKVVSGMDVIEKIKTTPTGPAAPSRTDVPKSRWSSKVRLSPLIK